MRGGGDSPGRSVGSDGAVHFVDHDGRMHGGRVDLQDLDVVRAVELILHDPGWLQDAGAGAERVLAVVPGDEPDPAPEHAEHLKVTLVPLETGRGQRGGPGRVLLYPDDEG